jgi:hypothetical protein
MSKGKVKGRFEGRLKPEFGNSIEIKDGSFDFDLNKIMNANSQINSLKTARLMYAY